MSWLLGWRKRWYSCISLSHTHKMRLYDDRDLTRINTKTKTQRFTHVNAHCFGAAGYTDRAMRQVAYVVAFARAIQTKAYIVSHQYRYVRLNQQITIESYHIANGVNLFCFFFFLSISHSKLRCIRKKTEILFIVVFVVVAVLHALPLAVRAIETQMVDATDMLL